MISPDVAFSQIRLHLQRLSGAAGAAVRLGDHQDVAPVQVGESFVVAVALGNTGNLLAEHLSRAGNLEVALLHGQADSLINDRCRPAQVDVKSPN